MFWRLASDFKFHTRQSKISLAVSSAYFHPWNYLLYLIVAISYLFLKRLVDKWQPRALGKRFDLCAIKNQYKSYFKVRWWYRPIWHTCVTIIDRPKLYHPVHVNCTRMLAVHDLRHQSERFGSIDFVFKSLR